MTTTVDNLIDLSLLDYLAYKTGCLFPSDLRYAEKCMIRRVVEKTPAETFSMNSWLDAIEYMSGVPLPVQPERCEDAKQILLKGLM